MKQSRQFSLIIFTISLLCFSTLANAQSVVYVKPVATGTADGSSWANALGDLQEAIDQAGSSSQIWVAGGTYKPSHLPNNYQSFSRPWTDRDFTFLIGIGTTIYGSFAGTESNLSERTPAVMSANPSILSGDIGTPGDITDNALHVVLIGRTTNSVDGGVLDGFTITGGNANVKETIQSADLFIYSDYGGGLMLKASTRGAFPKFANLIVRDNHASAGGAGLFVMNSFLTSLVNCKIMGNSAGTVGGGMYATGSSTTFDRVDLTGNQANAGGGLYQSGGYLYYSSMKNCTVAGNTAAQNAGGIFSDGMSAELTNVLISGNKAGTYGGGMVLGTAVPHALMTNVTISGNTKQGLYRENNFGQDHQIFPTLRNCIIYGNESGIVQDSRDSINLQYCLVQGIGADPASHLIDGVTANQHLFVDAPGYSAAPTIAGDYRLKPGAVAVNRGNNEVFSVIVPAAFPGLPSFNLTGITKDLDSLDRIADGVVDLGVYEGVTVPNLMPVLSFSPSIVNGTTNVDLVGEISEFNGKQTSGIITVYVLKDLLYNLSFNPAATFLGGQSVDNSIWSFDATSNPNYYLLTTSAVFAPNSVHLFGFTTNIAPGSLNGQSASGITILSGSGGDISNADNLDDDILVYQP